MSMPALFVGRNATKPAEWWRTAALPQRILVVFFVVGALLRIAASLAWWPTIPTFADAIPYSTYAATAPFGDPQHPAGYSLFLWIIGRATRQVGVITVVTHLGGLWTAGLLYGAVKRATGSTWPALVPAAFVLLNADQIYQEQLVASEPLSTLLLAGSLYAVVRAWDFTDRRLRWSLGAGALAAATTIVRTECVFLAPVLAIALVVALGRPVRRSLTTVAALLGIWLALLASYGLVKEAATGSFQVGPSPGWQLYGRAATFANCKLFTPPPGTMGLCEVTPPANRFGHDFYLYSPGSPVVKLFHTFGDQDGKVGAWSRAAIESQPGVFLTAFYHNLRDYFIPSDFAYVPGAGGGLDGELDWRTPADPVTRHNIIKAMEEFFAPFKPHRHSRRVLWLHDYQRVFRFGATALTLCTLLSFLGLFIGGRTGRAAIVAFGVGGFALLLPEALLGAYLGRYTVPIAGPMGAAAGITLWNLVRLERAGAALRS